MQTGTSRYRNLALFVLLAALWGTSFMVTKVGLRNIPPVLFAALRFDLGAILLFGYVAAKGLRWRPRTRSEWSLVAVGGAFMIGAHHALLFTGQQYVTSAVAAVLLGLVPVLTPALSRLFLADERLSPLGVAGILVGFAGVWIIASPDPANLLSANLRGVELVLLSAIVFALGAVLTHRNRTSLPTASMQAWMLLVGAVMLHVASLLLPGEAIADVVWGSETFAAIGYMGVVAGVVGYFMYFTLLSRLGPIEMSLIEYVIPVFAAISGWLVLGETVGVGTVTGFVVIFVGFVLVKRRALVREVQGFRTSITSR